MDNKQGTGNTSGTADSSAAAFMTDLLQKFGGPEKAMEAFAMFAAAMEKSVPAVSTSAVPPPEVSGASTPQTEAVAEPDTAVAEPATAIPDTTAVPDTIVAETHEEDADLVEGLELLAVGEPRFSVTKGETPVLDDRVVCVSEGVNHVVAAVDFIEKDTLNESVNVDLSTGVDSHTEGGTPVLEEFVEEVTPVGCEDIPEGNEALNSERNAEGETLEVVGGDEAQFVEEDVSEGKTPEKSVGTEAHDVEGSMGVETPIYITGATPLLSEGGAAPIFENVQEPVDDGMNLIVDLTEVPEGTDSPVNAREARRQAHRSLLDEIEEHVL